MKKILQPIGIIAVVVLFFSLPTFESAFTSWRSDRKNKKYAEDELERLIKNYGLKIQNPIEDFIECNFHYSLTETMIELNQINKEKFSEMSDKELIDKDTFMVNCIPIIQEVLDKCDCRRNDNCKLVHVEESKVPFRDCFKESGLLIFK